MGNESLKASVRRKFRDLILDLVKDNEAEPWRVIGSDTQTGMIHVAPETDPSGDPRHIVEVPQFAFSKPNAGDRVRIKKGRSQPGFHVEAFSYDETNDRTYPDTVYADTLAARDAAVLSLQDTTNGTVTLTTLASQAPSDAGYWVNAADDGLSAEQVVPASAAVLGSDASSNPQAATLGEDYLDPDQWIVGEETELTINGGIVTATQAAHTIDTQGDAASDELNEIAWDGEGAAQATPFCFFRAADEDRTVVMKHDVTNLWCWNQADITLDTTATIVIGRYFPGVEYWFLYDLNQIGTDDDAVHDADFNAKGDLLSASADDTPAILSVGSDGLFLKADSGESTGLIWGDTRPMTVVNNSGAAVSAGDIVLLQYDGTDGYEAITTTTAEAIGVWAVAETGAADGTDITVFRRGDNITVNYTGAAPSKNDYLTTSATAGLAQGRTTMHPGVFAICTANGAGGEVVATLITQTEFKTTPISDFLLYVNGHSGTQFVAKINGAPAGAVLTYDTVTGNEDSLVPARTSFGKLVIHNTTRSESAYIEDVDTGANQITLTENVPGTWANNDDIQVNSLTNTGSVGNDYYFDVYVGGEVPPLARALNIESQISDSGGAGDYTRIHPYEDDAIAKRLTRFPQVAGESFASGLTVPLIASTITWQSRASGASTKLDLYRVAGYYLAAP